MHRRTVQLGLSLLLLAGTAGVWVGCEEDAECAVAADCDDGIYCNGEEICDEGRCESQGAVQCGDDDVFWFLQIGPRVCEEAMGFIKAHLKDHSLGGQPIEVGRACRISTVARQMVA